MAAQRPANGAIPGRKFWATDTQEYSRWDGLAWYKIGGSGAGSSFTSGTFAGRPASSTVGTGYVAQDVKRAYVWNGSRWVAMDESLGFNVLDYGATLGSGDSTTALANTATAAGANGVVIVPGAINVTALPNVAVTYQGVGLLSSITVTGSGDGLTTSGARTIGMRDITYQNTASGGHLISLPTTTGLTGSLFENVVFNQLNAGKSVISGLGNTNFVSNLFDNCAFNGLLTQSVPLLNLFSAGGLNANTWRKSIIHNTGAFWMHLEDTSNSTFHRDNSVLDTTFEVCNGGGIRSYSGYNFVVDRYGFEDLGTTTNDLIVIGKNTGLLSTNNRIANGGRRGGTLGGGLVDVRLQTANATSTLLENLGNITGSGFTIDYGSNAVTELNQLSALTRQNSVYEWTAVSAFTNGWASGAGAGLAAPSYRRSLDNRHAELAGVATGGTSGTAAFTLPAAFRPTTNRFMSTPNGTTAAGLSVNIAPSGVVTIYGGAATDARYLDCVFPIDI